MPDTLLRTKHEQELESIQAILFLEFQHQALSYAQQSFQEPPRHFWSSLRNEFILRIKPIVRNIQYESAIRMATEVGEYLSPNQLIDRVEWSANATVNQMADQFVTDIRDRAYKNLQEIEWEGAAIAAVIAALLSEINKKRFAIGITTNSITAGEMTAAKQVKEIINNRRHFGHTILGEPPRHDAKHVELVAYWQVQTAGDKPDEKVCPICFPLHNRRLDNLEERFRKGPQAHPS